MNVITFDIIKGIYHFALEHLNTSFHSHPVVEIVKAEKGCFSLESPERTLKSLVFAIIDANTKHKIVAENASLVILMLESNNTILKDFLSKNDLSLDNGVCTKTHFDDKDGLFFKIKTLAQTKDLKKPSDQRVALSIKIIEELGLAYKDLVPTILSKVFLSHSRISHLFKEHIGISIKRYLVWSRLRLAVVLFLNEQEGFTSIAHQTGFFDQAHLSNAFKRMLGVSPVETYNSRIVQS